VYEAKEELTQKNQLKKRKQILNENCNRCGCAKSHWETVGNGEKQRGEMGKLLVISRPTCIGLVGFGLRIGWRCGLKGQ